MEMELERKMIENEEEEKRNHEIKKKTKLGGFRTMPFILASEICDRFATSGSHANMITYLTQELNMPLVKASNTLTNFAGTASFTPLIGALIADSFAGRFWTIIVGSVIYELGLVSITISALLPQFRPPPCPTQENCKEASNSQLWVLYISLLLQSLGSGGIRPCVVTFAADQFDMSKSKQGARGWNFFNWYYFSMAMATLTALTVVVYIQDNVGWGWGLGLPTVAMALSIIAFVFASPLYNKLKPGGSPLVRLAQVIAAAAKKRKAPVPADPSLLYENKELDAAISSNGRLIHTKQFKWFDRAAIVTEDDNKSSDSNYQQQPINLWRLATIHRVEELKSIIRMLPIWAAGILLVTSHSHLHSFTIQQARTMDRHFSHHSTFQMPPASLSIFSILVVLVGLVVYERLFVPIARRFTGNPAGITCLQRMGVGFSVNILSTIVSALVEIKRKGVAANHGLLDKPRAVIPVSVFWLVPQFCLNGVAEVFMSVGHLEFLYDQSPESMRSTAAALYWIATSIGNYIGTLLVSLVHSFTGKERNWLLDRNLNRGRLDYYYWLVTGIQVINLIYYVFCAYFYTYKPLEEEVKDQNGDDSVAFKPLNSEKSPNIGQAVVELQRNDQSV
ncbi:protein NRT1/ PTR FAMILY 3.1-like [Cornus florida]|uniref:protein NRT1/ PTR FAMILY 3.1-like n=1 Tax=Cornus florida TaxID=4283 RepID=UPI00289A6006|nr:protein NRT1/ PTR FAMILY 3.1-like [Cornus florida]